MKMKTPSGTHSSLDTEEEMTSELEDSVTEMTQPKTQEKGNDGASVGRGGLRAA